MNGDASVTFLQRSPKQVSFLKKAVTPFLAIIEPPFPPGRSKQQYRLTDETVAMTDNLFTKR